MARRAFGSIRKVAEPGRRPFYKASFSVPAKARRRWPGTPARASKSFPLSDRRGAGLWLAEQERLLRDSKWLPAKARKAAEEREDTTFASYWRPWLDHRTWRGRPLRPSTRRIMEESIRNHVLPGLGGVRLRDVTQETIDRWLDTLPDQPAMRWNALKTVKAMLRTASRPGDDGSAPLIPRYPLTRSLPKPARRSVTVPATPAQARAIMEAMPPRYRMVVALALYCGALRIGEACALQRRDIDLGRMVLHVRRERIASGPSDVGPTKTPGSVRDARIPRQLEESVRELLAQTGDAGEAWLFPMPSDPSRPVSTKTVRAWFDEARKAAGRPDLRFHDLRHTALTWLADQGATVRELMDEAGHTTPEMAMRYQHATSERAAMLADRLGRSLEGDAPDGLRQRIAGIDEEMGRLRAERERLERRLREESGRSARP